MAKLYKHKVVKSSGQTPVNTTKFVYSSRGPFWLPAISYYFLTFAIASILFFIIWGVLHEGGDETPWIPAGVFASLVLIAAVFIREVFLRKARKRYLIAKKKLDYNLSKLPIKSQNVKHRTKFTLNENANMINHIKEKSDAARVLKRLPQGHLDVFEMCNEYLSFTKNELHFIDKNSPRYLSVRKGRQKIRKVHKYHLLKWAEVKTKVHMSEAKNKVTVTEKVESAQKALTVLDSALKYYPRDNSLSESQLAILEFISTLKIKNLIGCAEKLVFEKKYQDALGQYKDILFLLTRDKTLIRDRKDLEAKINNEITQLNLYLNN